MENVAIKDYIRILVAIFLTILVVFYFSQETAGILSGYFSSGYKFHTVNCSNFRHRKEFKSNKWIVVTTIAAPSEQIKYLASLSDWQVLIVADTKTPRNKWSSERIIFLSIEDQICLSFK